MKKAYFQLNAIRKLLGLSFKFVDATLADGTAVKVEPEVDEGASVVVVTADGEDVPAPDGEHALADGRVIVTTDGVIIQVIEAAASAELEDKDKDEEEFKASDLIELVHGMADRIKAIEAKQGEFKPQAPEVTGEDFTTLKADVAKLSAELASASEVVVKLANQSKEKPITKFKKATPPSGDEINEVYANALFPDRKKK